MVYINLAAGLTPITAQPFQRGYREYAPHRALKPYIRCFWTCGDDSRLVTPDLCADIIFDLDERTAFFCGVSDAPFLSQRGDRCFGIRFYAWTAALFAEDALRGTLNGGFELGGHFRRLERELAARIFAAETAERRIALSEDFLVRSLGERQCGLFTQAMGEIIDRRGVCRTGSVAKELHVSGRQLERIFAEYSGLSPKKTAELVRYQLLWRDVLTERDFNAAEKALEYGYTDQPHLIKEFRRFHSMPPTQARRTALMDIGSLVQQ